MKSLIAAVAATSVLLVGACSLPKHVVPGVEFVLEAHDITDSPISIMLTITLKASALNPDLIGEFEEPDTGAHHPFRDPVTRVDLPILLEKHTPYSAPIHFPPGEIINFDVRAFFFGHYGDVVHCYFRDSTGHEIAGTRQQKGIFEPALRDKATLELQDSVSCSYAGTAV